MLRQNVSRFGVLSVLWACAMSALVAPPAPAQVVFEDNFNGNALAAHWVTPPASHWDYDVSGGMLNVHRVLFPSHPKSPTNDATIGTSFSSHAGDFLAIARVVWETNSIPSVIFGVGGVGTTIGTILYGGNFVVIQPPGAGGITRPGAGAGVHDIAIQRVGSQVSFFLDGASLGSFPDLGLSPVSNLGLRFISSFPAPLGDPVRVDFVRVVPSPTGAMMLAGLCSLIRGRTR